MIQSISVYNYHFIHDVTIHFSKGIHGLIGESGSGKSMLLSAFQNLLQSKIDRSVIGRFADHTKISVELNDGQTISHLVKTITSTDTITTLNGQTIPLSKFIHILSSSLSIIAQNGYLYQLQSDVILSLIDTDSQCQILAQQYLPVYQHYVKLKRALKRIEDKIHDPATINDHIHAINEINNAPYQSESDENEAKQIERDYESLQEKSRLFDKFQQFASELSALLASFNTYYPLYDQTTFNTILNLTSSLNTLIDSVNIEPTTINVDIDALQQDLYKQSQLKRKYKVQSSDQLMQLALSWQDELTHQQNYIDTKNELVETIAHLEGTLMRIAHQWNIQRSLVLSNLKDKLYPLLKQMGMSPLTIHQQWMDKPFSDNGNTKLVLTLDYNHHTMALDQLSGGEKSRFAVGLYTILSTGETMLFAFDEIDSGLSGQSLNALCTTLKDLSKNHCILLLTHHPYMAVSSDTLYTMVKTIEDDQVIIDLKELKDDAKLNAVAKMGSGEINESTLSYTKAMLDSYGTHHLSH